MLAIALRNGLVRRRSLGHQIPIHCSNSSSSTLSYTYDSGGNLLALKSSNTNGISDTYTYDALDRLSTVTYQCGEKRRFRG